MSEGKGRRNPPEHTRFKKGQSGNARGRPKGRKNLKTIVEEELNKLITVRQPNGRTIRKTKLALMMEQLTNDGLRGQPRAREQAIKLAQALQGEADVRAQGSADGDQSDDGLVPDAETLRQILGRFAHLRDDDQSS